MPHVLVALAVALVGTPLAWSWGRSGSYRRPDETAPLPAHGWLVPAVPVLTAALVWVARDEPLAAAGATALLAPVGLLLLAVDADVHRLPNALTLPLAAAVLALLALAAATSGQWPDLRRALVASAAVGGAFVLVSLVLGSRGIGMGDAKLMLAIAPLLGWYGWPTLLVGVYAAFALGGLAALVLLVLRRADRATHLAFGPYLVLGAVLALLVRA